jgi:hypothetical protein
MPVLTMLVFLAKIKKYLKNKVNHIVKAIFAIRILSPSI